MIKEFISNIHKKIKPYEKNIIFPLLKIIGIIIVCAVLVRMMNGHETLSEYANKHPDIAYSTSIDE